MGQRKGYKQTEEHRKNIGEAKRGVKRKPFSAEWRKKMGKLGEENSFYGKHHTEENKRFFRESQLGEKAWAWKGGLSCLPYPPNWRNIKSQVKERDKSTCQLCDKVNLDEKDGENGAVRFSVHHIDYEKSNTEENNLIYLCNGCHMKTNFKREYWKEKLEEIMRLK